MKKLLVAITFILFSCKPVMIKQYKITANGNNYYTNEFRYVKDSIYFTEHNRNGKIRFQGGFKTNEVKIQ